MDEVQGFIRALKYHRLTSQQRKTLRGQALTGNLQAAQAGLRKIVSKGIQHDRPNAAGRIVFPADYNPRKDLKPCDPEYVKLKRSIMEFGYVEHQQ